MRTLLFVACFALVPLAACDTGSGGGFDADFVAHGDSCDKNNGDQDCIDNNDDYPVCYSYGRGDMCTKKCKSDADCPGRCNGGGKTGVRVCCRPNATALYATYEECRLDGCCD